MRMLSLLCLTLILATTPLAAFADDAPIVEPMVDEFETWKLYSRGNDDTDEVDDKGQSNFETAQVRATLLTGLNRKGTISVWLLYHSHLVTDDYGSVYEPQWEISPELPKEGEKGLDAAGAQTTKHKQESSLLDDPGSQKAKLRLRRSAGGRPRDSSLEAVLWLGLIDPAKKNKTYEGKLNIGLPSDDPSWLFAQVENIDWKVVLKDGKVVASDINVKESDRPNKRASHEVLRLIRTSDSPDFLDTPFPTRVGKCIRQAKKN